jgi:predicted RNA-binding Zn-ribbon protein involved in translation (DUF1610 family)
MNYDDDGYFIEAEEKPDYWYCPKCGDVYTRYLNPPVCYECEIKLEEGYDKIECEN